MLNFHKSLTYDQFYISCETEAMYNFLTAKNCFIWELEKGKLCVLPEGWSVEFEANIIEKYDSNALAYESLTRGIVKDQNNETQFKITPCYFTKSEDGSFTPEHIWMIEKNWEEESLAR